MEPTVIKLDLPADHKYLNVAGACLAAILERQAAAEPEILIYNTQLALQEACTNIVNHAYANQPAGTIQVEFTLAPAPARLVIDLYDSGQPFNTESATEPNLDEIQVHGYGFFLMRELMDQVSYQRLPQGNHWQLVKNL